MKFCRVLLSLLFVLSICKVTFAEVTDDMYQEVLQRLKNVEESVGGLNDYFVKVNNIESDFNKLSSQLENGQKNPTGSMTGNDDYYNAVNKKFSQLEETVNDLKDRATLMDMTEEIRRVQEYVCPNGHVHPVKGTGGKCPLDGLKQKSRNRYKLHKFARRESISERISSAVEEEFERHIVLGSSATGIVQQVLSSDEEEKSFAEGSFDLVFISQPLLHTTFFVDLEAIGGNGPDDVFGTLSGLNDDSGSLQDDDGVDRLSVREVWLQSYLLNQRLRVVGGKIDLTNYFDSNVVANDETTQFISSAFVNNATMEAPENGPGIVAFFDTRSGFTFGLGLQNDDNSGFDITDQIYGIAEIGYRSHLFFGQEGNYRLWGRINGAKDDNSGFGLSFDQNISTRLAAFARFGANEVDSNDDETVTELDTVSRRFVTVNEVDIETEGDSAIASAWSVGMRLRSPFFSRVNDEVAVAFGSLDIAGGDDESITEVYYKLQINEHFAITPSFQAVFDPVGVGSDDVITVAGIRTQLEF